MIGIQNEFKQLLAYIKETHSENENVAADLGVCFIINMIGLMPK